MGGHDQRQKAAKQSMHCSAEEAGQIQENLTRGKAGFQKFRNFGAKARGLARDIASKAGNVFHNDALAEMKAVRREDVGTSSSPQRKQTLKEITRSLKALKSPFRRKRRPARGRDLSQGPTQGNEEDEDQTANYCNDAALTTDVQVIDVIYEDAPSDLRYLFWAACSRRNFHKFENFRDAWKQMSDIFEDMKSSQFRRTASNSSSHERDPELNTRDVASSSGGDSHHADDFEAVISNDLDRIFPGHDYLDSRAMKDKIFAILKAYALHDSEVGYCQGMAYMAALSALYLTEEEAVGLLVELMDRRGCNLRAIYQPGLGILQETLRQLEDNMALIVPRVYHHFQDCGVPAVLFATSWFLTLYAASFPLVMSCRIIDMMLGEGNYTILVKVALSLLHACENDLMQCSDAEQIISYLKTKSFAWTSDQLRSILSSAQLMHLEGETLCRVRLTLLEDDGIALSILV